MANKEKTQYVLDADKINVLVMGTSGAGKSTLINAIISEANAPTGSGRAVTTEMKPYSTEDSPLVLIDSVGYEFNILRQLSLKREINKWTKSGVKNEDASKLIHMIWFCIDGQNKRVFDEVLDSIRNVSKFWKDVPIIVVFTKSYGTDEEDENNIKMFQEVLDTYKHKKDLNIKDNCIIPVVAKEYTVPGATIGIKGLDKLVSRTRELMPEAKKTAEKAVRNIELDMKYREATAITSISTVGAAVVGAVPIHFPDATILVPIQSAMLGRISKIYDIEDKTAANSIIETIMKVGATTIAGKALLNWIKDIPEVTAKISASVLSAAVAGSITFVAGEVSTILFDKISRGEIVPDENVDWTGLVTTLFNDKLPKIIEVIANNFKDIEPKDIPSALANAIAELLNKDKDLKKEDKNKKKAQKSK